MAEIKGYLGAVYASTSDIPIAETSVDTGDGSTTDFQIFIINGFIRPDTLQVRVSDEGSDVTYNWLRDYNFSPQGAISFHIAPSDGGDILIAYDKTVPVQKTGFFNWSVDITNDTQDVTDFSSTGWRKFQAGLTTWTATAERHWQNGSAASDLTEAAKSDMYYIKFYDDTDNGTGLCGWAKVTGVSPGVAVDAVVNESISMQGFDRMYAFEDIGL